MIYRIFAYLFGTLFVLTFLYWMMFSFDGLLFLNNRETITLLAITAFLTYCFGTIAYKMNRLNKRQRWRNKVANALVYNSGYDVKQTRFPIDKQMTLLKKRSSPPGVQDYVFFFPGDEFRKWKDECVIVYPGKNSLYQEDLFYLFPADFQVETAHDVFVLIIQKYYNK